MVDDRDVFKAAAGLTKNFGDDAEFECSQIAEKWEARGHLDAARLWRRVLSAIEELRKLPN